MWRWGLYFDDILAGVVSYNLPTRNTCACVFGVEHAHKVWHMGRLALHEDAPKNSESRLIGLSLRAIEETRPDVWAVLTYSDLSQGHIGTIYQATNALYTGIGGKGETRYIDSDGKLRSDYLSGRRVSAARAESLGWTSPGKSPGKHRYLYILGDRRERRERRKLLRLPVLPYPKLSDYRGCP